MNADETQASLAKEALANALRPSVTSEKRERVRAMLFSFMDAVLLEAKGTERGKCLLESYANAVCAVASAVPVAPDREALARALYIIDGHADDAERLARVFNEDYQETTRIYYGEQADRLVRILGGFPVDLQQQPRAWECPKCDDAKPWTFRVCRGDRAPIPHVAVPREDGTPLYARGNPEP